MGVVGVVGVVVGVDVVGGGAGVVLVSTAGGFFAGFFVVVSVVVLSVVSGMLAGEIASVGSAEQSATTTSSSRVAPSRSACFSVLSTPPSSEIWSLTSSAASSAPMQSPLLASCSTLSRFSEI